MKNKSNLNAFQKMVVGVQFLFVAFGVMVLMPLLVGGCSKYDSPQM